MSKGRREMKWELKSYKSAEKHKEGLGAHHDSSREVLRDQTDQRRRQCRLRGIYLPSREP